MPNTFDHSPADVLRRLLIQLGLGTAPETRPLESWPIYASNEPSDPDNCITVYDTAGTDDGRSMIDGELFGHYGIQVRVRSLDHATGWLKADAIQTALAETVYDNAVTIGGSSYLVHSANKIGDVLALGKDVSDTKRSLFTLNAVLSLT